MALMAVAAAVPLVILLNPTWLERIPPPAGKPLLTILVDRSASMATRDAGRRPDPLPGRRGLRRRPLPGELGDRYEVRVRTFADDLVAGVARRRLSKQEPDGAATDLAAAVQEALEDDRPQGQAMLLLSDGIHNAGSVERLRQSAAKAKAMAAPVYVKTIGGPAAVNDLEVSLAAAAGIGLRRPARAGGGQPCGSAGRWRRRPASRCLLDGKPVENRDVALKRDDAGRGGLLRLAQAERAVSLRGPRRRPAGRSHHGQQHGAAAAARRRSAGPRAAAGRQAILGHEVPGADAVGRPVDRVDQRGATCRGAAAAAENPAPAPTDESRLRQQTNRRDTPATGTPATASGASSGPSRRTPGSSSPTPTRLASYQIVILGRNAEVFLTDDALAKLRKWLAEGEGSLVCFRGPPASQIGQRLGELMPVRWTPAAESRFRVQLTGVGQALRWLPVAGDGKDQLAELPSLATTTRPEASKALAVVLATGIAGGSGQPSPVMAYQPVGNGRVVVVEGAGMWRWAFLAPEHQQQEEIYGSLWRSLVRWLVANVGLLPSQRLALRADKLTFSTDENVTATLLVRDWSGEPPQVELSRRVGRPRRRRSAACRAAAIRASTTSDWAGCPKDDTRFAWWASTRTTCRAWRPSTCAETWPSGSTSARSRT